MISFINSSIWNWDQYMISRYTILYQLSNYLKNSSWFSYLYLISFGGWCLLFGSAYQVRVSPGFVVL